MRLEKAATGPAVNDTLYLETPTLERGRKGIDEE